MRDLLRQAQLPPDGLEAHLETLLVARAGDEVIGCAALELYGEDALLRSVAVDASLRGQGLGVDLTERALDLARRCGVRSIYLLTDTAVGFFPRFGFHSVSRSAVAAGVKQSVEFTSVCPETAEVMVLELAEESE